MKAKVLIAYTDKVTGKTHDPGDIVELSAKRFNEIRDQGRYIQLMDDVKPPKTETKTN